MPPNGAGRAWNEWLRKLKAFRRAYGHCRVPPGWAGNPRLAAWVAEQRDHFDRLLLESLSQLYRFDFDIGWDRHWLSRFFELMEFKRFHGHCNVPARWPDNPQLGSKARPNWIPTIRF